MKSVLITGCNGFLGSHLIDFLANKDLDIIGLIRPKNSLENLSHYTNGKVNFNLEEKLISYDNPIQIPTNKNNLEILECDITDRSLLEKIILKVKPNFIFHLAAQPHVMPSWENPFNTIEINVIGTLNIFEPLKKFKINSRVILACSSAEYGTTTKLNRSLRETDPLLAIHPYGISKIAMELLARQYFINFGIETINLRFFNQTGPRKTDDACSDFVSKVAQIELGLKEPVIEVGNLNPYRDITGVKDTIQAIWLAATNGKPGETYNVCSNRKTRIRDILDIVLSFSKKKIKILENSPKKLRKTDEDIILGDNSKIKKELGFKVTQKIEEVLKNMFDYWLEYYKKKK